MGFYGSAGNLLVETLGGIEYWSLCSRLGWRMRELGIVLASLTPYSSLPVLPSVEEDRLSFSFSSFSLLDSLFIRALIVTASHKLIHFPPIDGGWWWSRRRWGPTSLALSNTTPSQSQSTSCKCCTLPFVPIDSRYKYCVDCKATMSSRPKAFATKRDSSEALFSLQNTNGSSLARQVFLNQQGLRLWSHPIQLQTLQLAIPRLWKIPTCMWRYLKNQFYRSCRR